MKEKSTILIVDDSELNRTVLADILGDEYNFIEAENGARAIELLRTHTDIDLILLDMVMPEMNGFEVCKLLRDKGRSTPVLIITAREEEKDKILGLDLGADDYITKPFSPLEMVARVKAQLRRATPTMVSQGILIRRMVSTRSEPSSTMPNPPLMDLPMPTPPPLCRAIRLMPRAALPA